MGALAAVIDWQQPIDSSELDAMVALVPRRSSASLRRGLFRCAGLAEASACDRRVGNPTIITEGHLAIVGDLRLWNRGSLVNRAGGPKATAGMSDRLLLLVAYRRTGIGFLNDVDGEFAFVIWDDRERRAIAVRDRFGSKPLFYERTATGIRFATEPKQLAATSTSPVRPCARSVAEYLIDHYRETRFSFFDGVLRVRPSMVLTAQSTSLREERYWNPSPDTVPPERSENVSAVFRERLVEAVRVRTDSAGATIAHLTGGLDSSSITAAAHLLRERDQLPSPFQTISAVFPGHPGNESLWIDEIAERQPFAHSSFSPRIDGIERFDTDMWDADQPRVHRIRDMWEQTAAIGNGIGADLVLTGFGGDQILDQDQLIIDRLRSGPASRRFNDARNVFSGSPARFSRLAVEGARDMVPRRFKAGLRRVVPRREIAANPLVNSEFRNRMAPETPESAPSDFGFSSLSQNGVVAFAQHATISWFSEIQEAEYASRGLDVSHPYLDRSVVEYVASIPIDRRPLDGRTKTLVRDGFAGFLPESVLDRRTKTVADEYLDLLFVRHGAEYRVRYPTVSDTALEYLDSDRYDLMMRSSNAAPPSPEIRESLWNAWTLMAWLDGLRRYRS